MDFIEKWIPIVGLMSITFLIFVNVIARYILKQSIVWAEELTTYVIIWATFVGSSYCVKHNMHVGIDALVMILPKPLKRVVAVFVHLAGFAISLLLLVYGVNLTKGVHDSKQLSPALMLPMWYAYLALPVSGALMTVRFVQALAGALRPSPAGQMVGDRS